MSVIKKLRIQIVAVIVLVQMILVAGILLTVDYCLARHEIVRSRHYLETIAENGGVPPLPDRRVHKGNFVSKKPWLAIGSDDSFFPLQISVDKDEMRNFFSVKITPDGVIGDVIKNYSFDLMPSDISKFVGKVLAECRARGGGCYPGKTVEGTFDGILFYMKVNDDGSRIISAMNRRVEIMMLYYLVRFSVVVFVASMVVATVFAFFLSGFVIRPTRVAFEKQKAFIADAGHELKTPIAVIGANLDVLAPDMPGNRWLSYIREENERMSHLVKNLLYLAKDDAGRNKINFAEFDFTDAVRNSVLPFESTVFEEKKRLELGIREGLRFVGDEQQIKQVVVILVDNAVKNSEEGSTVRISAVAEKDKIILRVFNTGHGIKSEDLDKIFRRFYRSDSSRARKTGGYGLGLAIARTIAAVHKGTLTVDSKFGEWAEFTLTLPMKKGRKKSFFGK